MDFETHNLPEYDDTLPENLEELRATYIVEGGNPRTKSFAAKEADVLVRAQRKIDAEFRRRDGLRPKWSKSLSNFVAGSLSTISVIFVVAVTVFGVLGVSLLMVVAEVAVIHQGISTVAEANSWLYAHALVLLYLVMLFAREIIAHNPTDVPKTHLEVFSIQHLRNWWSYFAGGRNWKPRLKHKSLLTGANFTVKWLMATVLLFGVLGRLDGKLAGIQGNWVAGLRHIVESSSLEEMLGYIATIGISVGLMLGAHFITNFVYREYAKLTGGINTADFFGDFSPDLLIEREMTTLYRDEILRLRAKRQAASLPVQEMTE
jgi:hypothetical protein